MAVTVYDNTNVTPGVGSSPVYASASVAFSFTSDSNVSDALSSLTLGLYDGTPSDGGSVTISLYADGTNSAPGTLVGTLATVADSSLGTTTAAQKVITPTSTYTLSANTRYWIGLVSSVSGPREAFVTSFSGTTGVSGEYNYSFGSGGANAPSGAYVAQLQEATVACFLQGTCIATDRGETAVEQLRQGDTVRLARGGLSRIAWIGRRTLDCARHPRPWDVLPVRILAGAFAPGLPARDLLLSPDHAVYVDGVLIPVRYLINDATICQDHADTVTYWHVELERHDILLAEGMPAESYLDCGNRDAFENADVTSLHAAFDPRDLEAWRQRACAPLVEAGPMLDAVRARLAERAGPLLPSAETLHIHTPGVLRATLPAGTTRVHLVSRPTHAPGERRRLGAAIAGITQDGVAMPIDGPGLASGFHEVETGWRWTDGAGVLLLEPKAGPTVIEVTVVMLSESELRVA